MLNVSCLGDKTSISLLRKCYIGIVSQVDASLRSTVADKTNENVLLFLIPVKEAISSST